MLKKTLQLIKTNPLIVICYTIYLVFSILLIYFLYPKSFGVGTYTQGGVFDYSLYMVTMRNMLIAVALIFILSLFFISGYGGMTREAVLSGKTKLFYFLDGIKNYFGRVLLSALLTGAVVIVGSILLGLLSIPFTIMAVANGTNSIYIMTMVIMLVTLILVLIPTPFVALWLPAMFLEDTSIMRSLKFGAKAGAKNYFRLLIVSIILILPQVIYSILNYSHILRGTLFSVEYFILLGIMALTSMIYNIYLFIVYHEYKIGLITILQQPDGNINP